MKIEEMTNKLDKFKLEKEVSDILGSKSTGLTYVNIFKFFNKKEQYLKIKFPHSEYNRSKKISKKETIFENIIAINNRKKRLHLLFELCNLESIRSKGSIKVIRSKIHNEVNKNKRTIYDRLQFKKFWKIYIAGGLFILLSILSNSLNIIDKINSNIQVKKTKDSGEAFEEDMFFNILILPFHPDRNCTVLETKYERKFMERLDEYIRNEAGIEMDIKLVTNEPCPLNNDEAYKIAEKHGADLIIWGAYDEECEGEKKVRLRYNLIGHIGEIVESRNSTIFRTGDTNYLEYDSVDELRSGKLLDDIENVLNWISVGIFYDAEYYDRAYNFFSKLKLGKCDEKILEGYAGVCFKLGKIDEAYHLVEDILECNPKNSYALVEKAISLTDKNNIKEAIEIYTELLTEDPCNEFILERYAIICYEIGERNEANQLIEKILSCNPKNSYALYQKAINLARDNNFKEGVEIYTKLLTENPYNLDYLRNRAWSYNNLGDKERAFKDLKLVDSLDIHDVETLNLLGSQYEYRENYDLALNYYLKSDSMEFRDYVKLNIINVYLIKGNIDSALYYYNQVKGKTQRYDELKEVEKKIFN